MHRYKNIYYAVLVSILRTVNTVVIIAASISDKASDCIMRPDAQVEQI